LSVPVQVIAWKDLSPKCVEWDVKLYSLTHSLAVLESIYYSRSTRGQKFLFSYSSLQQCCGYYTACDKWEL